MNILFVFCDMLRANLLKTVNNKLKENTEVDDFLRDIGGTFYANCYTPAPDTPRSLASLFTGRYPKFHGCEKRIQWIEFYLKPECPNIFEFFLDHGYSISAMFSRNDIRTGIVPKTVKDRMYLSSSLQDTVNNVKNVMQTTKNTFTFLSLTDYHWAMDDYGYNRLGHLYGQKYLMSSFKSIFHTFDKDDFDYIFVFSDHGCKIDEDYKYKKEKAYLLDDDRSKIVMFLRKKGDVDFQINLNVTTIMDVFPTILEALEIVPESSIDGVSLLAPKQERFIVIEDQSIFRPIINSVHDLWALRTDDFFYLETLGESLLLKVEGPNMYSLVCTPEEQLLEVIREKIAEYSCSYAENKKQFDILQIYTKEQAVHDFYSNGEKRVNGKSLIGRLRNKFLRIKLGNKTVL